MRLDEFQPDAGDQRVKRLKDNAKAAKNKATELKAQVDTTAAQLDMQNSRQQLTKQQRSPAMSTIKPYH